MELQEIIDWFKSNYNQKNIEGMRRFGIVTDKAFGISSKQLDDLRKVVGTNHEIAIKLWETGYHETKMLAALIADPKLVSPQLMDKWVLDFDNWAICDSVCGKLFRKTSYVYDKIDQWAEREELYVKRAAFALIAWIAVHHKKQPDDFFLHYYDLIITHSKDERDHIKKAVNWALRQIGKRSRALGLEALEICELLHREFSESRSAKWIASDAKRELK
ncbi:MAG: DNA alkylation repair protein, partial [Candidatus Kapaibacterium sp.]